MAFGVNLPGVTWNSWYNPLDNASNFTKSVADPNKNALPFLGNPWNNDSTQSQSNTTPSNQTNNSGVPWRADTPAPVNNTNTQSAEQRAAAQRASQITGEINRLNSLLGVYAPQRDAGNQSIDAKFNEQKTRLGEQRTKANSGYDEQDALALQGRTRGYEQVDNYAKSSADSLSRVFQGANAGNSSVARLLAPQLVGKAADERRGDVTETANQNISGIRKARDEANTEFGYADQELENNRGYEKESLEKGILQSEADVFNQRLGLEREGGRDTTGTQNEINSRTQRLSQLFGAGRFNPNYQVRAVAPKAVALNDYKVDPVEVQAGSLAQSGGFYAPQLKKKQELRAS